MTILAAGLVTAAPVRWTLNGVTLNDGGTATGSFVYDASNGTFSSVSITTSGGTATGSTYIASVPAGSTATAAVFVPTTVTPVPAATPYFFLQFGNPLTNSGGSINLLVNAGALSEGTCNAGCTGPATQIRSISTGSIFGLAVVTTGVPALSPWGVGSLALLLASAGVMLSRRLDQQEPGRG